MLWAEIQENPIKNEQTEFRENQIFSPKNNRMVSFGNGMVVPPNIHNSGLPEMDHSGYLQIMNLLQ